MLSLSGDFTNDLSPMVHEMRQYPTKFTGNVTNCTTRAIYHIDHSNYNKSILLVFSLSFSKKLLPYVRSPGMAVDVESTYAAVKVNVLLQSTISVAVETCSLLTVQKIGYDVNYDVIIM